MWGYFHLTDFFLTHFSKSWGSISAGLSSCVGRPSEEEEQSSGSPRCGAQTQPPEGSKKRWGTPLGKDGKRWGNTWFVDFPS